MEALIDEVSEVAYDKAVEVVTDVVRAQTQAADLAEIEGYRKWVNAPDRIHSSDTRNVVNKCLDAVTSRLKKLAARITEKIQAALQTPAARAANKAQIKEQSKKSILSMLGQRKAEIAQRDAERRSARPTKRGMER